MVGRKELIKALDQSIQNTDILLDVLKNHKKILRKKLSSFTIKNISKDYVDGYVQAILDVIDRLKL